MTRHRLPQRARDVKRVLLAGLLLLGLLGVLIIVRT
jgi:hypothetical protein